MADSLGKRILGTTFNVIIGRDKKRHGHGDATREVFETVVFVVVLVLMLKLFVAEAFVIPTGSMASTLWGDQVVAECPECGYEFAISAASSHGRPRAAPSAVACQNCGHAFSPKNANDWSSGDRVLVAKYEYHIRDPKRFDVPVFKYPEQPYNASELTAMNYIKRLVGLPGETIAIYKGDLYRTTALTYSHRKRPDNPDHLWRLRLPGPVSEAELNEEGATVIRGENNMYYIPSRDHTYMNDPEALKLFESGGFEPIRKSPEEILTVRRLVFDLDKQPKSLTGNLKTRWHPAPDAGAGWNAKENGFEFSGESMGWLRYQNVEPGWRSNQNQPNQPVEISDYLAYNSSLGAMNQVTDLLVECRAEFKSASDTVILELTKSGEKFWAEFADGKCRLLRLAAGSSTPVAMAEQSTDIGAGRYNLRLANFDQRLTVWVDGNALDFGDNANYNPPPQEPTEKPSEDLHEPARIGAKGSVSIDKVQLWRDIYYTLNEGDWIPRAGAVETHYVQPGHYFCLGDNSASSADGRSWGLVPERLMLGRAVVIYWPLSRIRVIK
jgi:signal peptidase I